MRVNAAARARAAVTRAGERIRNLLALYASNAAMPPTDEQSIRPGLWLVAAAFALGAGSLVWFAVAFGDIRRASGDDGARALDDGDRARGFERAAADGDGERGEPGRRRGGPRWESDGVGRTVPGPEGVDGAGDHVGFPHHAGAQSDSATDPQRHASRRSFGGGGDAGVALPFYETTRRAQITSIGGELDLGSNARCEVRVLPVASGSFNCLIRVMCDGVVLYPDPSQSAGYAPCDVENGVAVSGGEDAYTAADGDPMVRFDARRGTIVVGEDSPGRPRYSVALRML